jgi:hypothetical protein
MTSEELAKSVGCSKPWIFYLKKKFPERCPRNFNDVEGWKAVLAFSRTQAKVKYVRGATQPRNNGEQLSDIQRLTKARANKVETEHEILTIELGVTRRQIVKQEEVMALFGKIASITRARLMKLRADLPCCLAGLDAASIDRILGERFEEISSNLSIPDDFFVSKGIL